MSLLWLSTRHRRPREQRRHRRPQRLGHLGVPGGLRADAQDRPHRRVSGLALRDPEMIRGGRGGSIVHVSSVAGILGDPKLTPYNAAKGGVNLLTKNMALDNPPI